MIKKLISFFILLIIIGCSASHNSASDKKIILPGKYENYTLLPNGWKLTPAGDQVGIGELPLNLIITKDEKYAITSNSGTKENSLSVIDLENEEEVQRIPVNKTWRGIVFNNDETKLFVSGGNNNLIYIFNFDSGKLILNDSIVVGKPYKDEKISISGIDYFTKNNYLLAVSRMSNSLYVCNIENKKIIKTLKFDGECYDIKINHAQTFAYVSIWGKSTIAEIDLKTLSITNIIDVGDHPCEIIITKNDKRLFVTNANNNSVSVVNLYSKKETEKIISSLKSNMPYGSTPNSICFNKEESILIIANADNNYLALFDISKENKSQSLGFIPVGWYPTSVKMLSSNKIIVANAKGLSSRPNPQGPNPLTKEKYITNQYIAYLFKGTLSIIDFPNEKTLTNFSKRVYLNTPSVFDNKISNEQNIIPTEHDNKRSEKIRHVFYIIKENRTYDQVYGDMANGNGDTSICIFGKEITPNQHKLAETFTLFDNFYCDAEVSADGHNWSTAAYATDYVEKTWPVLYGGRGGEYDFEGGSEIAAPSSGYIWTQVINKKLGLRNYGEFVDGKKINNSYHARDENLDRYTCHTFPPFDMSISDLVRYSSWEKDFNNFLKIDSLPALNIIRLPNNHTAGTRKGNLTPQAFVAQNDFALGLIIDKISSSKFWNESIIFVVEDDAQNGSDHVDAHRSCLLVISPYIKRNFVDHTMYSTSSILKTIELILGLQPMTQFDLSAEPILAPIVNVPIIEPYKVIYPKIDIEAKNTADAYGSKRSGEFDFTKEDSIPDIELNEIIWKSIKGKNSKMPPPVRSAFVKNVIKNLDEDDD